MNTGSCIFIILINIEIITEVRDTQILQLLFITDMTSQSMHGTYQRTVKCTAGKGSSRTDKFLENIKQGHCAVTWRLLTMLCLDLLMQQYSFYKYGLLVSIKEYTWTVGQEKIWTTLEEKILEVEILAVV